MAHGETSVSAPHTAQKPIFSLASTIESASNLIEPLSAWTMCKAIRSAERGPIPGSLLSVLIRVEMGRGRLMTALHAEAREVEASRDFAHLGSRNLLGLPESLVRSSNDH